MIAEHLELVYRVQTWFGFYCEDDTVLLLFGEVKTSSDSNTPPSVMSGGSGMTWQLEQSATRLDIQHALLRWLHARCQDQPYRDLYRKAVKRYLASEGKELLLVGVLIRGHHVKPPRPGCSRQHALNAIRWAYPY